MKANCIIKVSLEEQSLLHGFLCQRLKEIEKKQKIDEAKYVLLKNKVKRAELYDVMEEREKAIEELEVLRKKVALSEVG